jgi:hypothetical protein
LRAAKLAGWKEGMNLALGRARELRTVTRPPIAARELWTVTLPAGVALERRMVTLPAGVALERRMVTVPAIGALSCALRPCRRSARWSGGW